MAHYPSHKELHKGLLEAAAASRRLNDQVHAGEHATAALAALVPPPAPAPGPVPTSPLGEGKR